ncbi:hypothetical protein SDC9_195787 [bioreactor metagenome]|uniref:Uncharacterized protein n=1 Tax=bioreactor metagenome TaxID=1076179 RepID=A0A645IBH3_9ZZZZ
MFALMFLIVLTASLIVSISFSFSLKFHSSLYSGHEDIIMLSSSFWICIKISSVIKGI